MAGSIRVVGCFPMGIMLLTVAYLGLELGLYYLSPQQCLTYEVAPAAPTEGQQTTASTTNDDGDALCQSEGVDNTLVEFTLSSERCI